MQVSFLKRHLDLNWKKMRSRMGSGSLLRDAATLGSGQLFRLLLQAVYFVLIARSLGPSVYGAFIAIVAVTSIVNPFSGMGSSTMFLRNVRAGITTPSVSWGNGLVLTISSGSILAVLTTLVAVYLHMPLNWWQILMISVSDLLLIRIADLASFGFAATGQMGQSAIQSVVISALRLCAIAVLAFASRANLVNWIVAYTMVSGVAAIYALFKGTQFWGRPQLDVSRWLGDSWEGLFFSISTSAQTVYNDIDKSMLSRLSSLSATGVYGAAYRLVDTAMTPTRALASAAYPRFFEVGASGVESSFRYARSLIRKSSLYGIGLSVTLFVTAPLLPLVLGKQYASSVLALRMLSVVPFLRCIHLFLSDSLSGSGYQKIRVAIQIGIAALNVGANLWVLPRWSWKGAAVISTLCDVVLLGAMLLANVVLSARERSAATRVPPQILEGDGAV